MFLYLGYEFWDHVEVVEVREDYQNIEVDHLLIKKALVVDNINTIKKSATKRVIAIASRKSERLTKNNFKFLYFKLCVFLCIINFLWYAIH